MLLCVLINGYAQVRNKWLRILETMGGRSGNMTGAAPYRTSQAADGASAGAQNSYNSGAASSGRGRGRGRGGPRGRGNGRGGSRVVPRQPTPPAMVSHLPSPDFIPHNPS